MVATDNGLLRRPQALPPARLSRAPIFALLAIFIALADTARTQEAAGPQPDTPIAVELRTTQDIAIATRLRSILAQIDGYEDVNVAVRAGVVTLTGEVLDAAAVARLEAIVRRVEGVVAIKDGVVQTTDLRRRLLPSIDRFEHHATEALAILPLLVVALVAFALVFALGLLVAGIRPLWERVAPNSFIAAIYRQIVRLVFFVAALLVALDILDATALLGSILGAAGIIGLAIGFAVRDTVENFLASVLLSIRQPFGPLDLVEIEGNVGKVVSLTSRATILLSADGNTIRVPNATVFKSTIVNFSRNPQRRFTFALDADPSANVAALRDAAREKLMGLTFVLSEPPPAVWIDTEGGALVKLWFAAWIDQTRTDFNQARGEAIRILRALMEARGATAPPPLSRVVSIDRDAELAERAAPSAHDLDENTITDLDIAGNHALERIVESDRQSVAATNLLGRGKGLE